MKNMENIRAKARYAMSVALRVLSVGVMVAFMVGGVLAGKVVSWFGAGAMTKMSEIMSMSVNWYVAGIVWILGLVFALITYGQGMILAALAEKE